MTAPRSFQLSAKKKVKDEEYEPRPYVLVSESETQIVEVDGAEVEKPKEHRITAHYPGDGAITLFLATMGTDMVETDVLSTLFAFLEQAFNREDYRLIRRLIRDEELEPEMLMDLVSDMLEGWMTFPTQPSSGSTPSRARTGTRSTGRVHGPGSTQ